MRFLKFLGIFILLASAFSVHAKQNQAIISHCLDTSLQPVPLSQVQFDGSIFISTNNLRVLRNPISTTYIIAFSDDYRSFGSFGSLSPDGKWFAYPTGRSQRANWTSRNYEFNRINFVNTHTGERVFSVPTNDYALFVSGGYQVTSGRIGWLSNVLYVVNDTTIINVETQLEEPLAYTGPLDLQQLRQGNISPDGTRISYFNRIVDIMAGETVVELQSGAARWLADGTGYYSFSSAPDTSTTIYDHDGNVRFSIDQYATVSNTGKWVGWSERRGDSANVEHNFLIMNTESGQTVELCSQIRDITFSPDDTQAAVLSQYGNNQRLWLIDLGTWEVTPIDAQLSIANRFVGWYLN